MTKSKPQTEVGAKCVLDRDLVNENTLPMMKDVGLSIFASACSKNRGAFVLHPPDGHTYGCLTLPKTVLELSHIQLNEDQVNSTTGYTKFEITRVEDITKKFADKNLTAAQAVKLLDFVVDSVYQSTPDVSMEPYACDVSGLVTLKCNIGKKSPIRAVSLAGVFTPALWATGGKRLYLDEAASFYSIKDFQDMKDLGLNTVQIPVPVKMFDENHEGAEAWKNLLLDTLHDIRKAGLDAILMLDATESSPEDIARPVENAAAFAAGYNAGYSDDVIIAMVLPSVSDALMEGVSMTAPDLPIWMPIQGGDFKTLGNYPLAAAASLEMSHTAVVADIASSTSEEDRAKLFYHENMACIARAPLEYSRCFQDMPVMVGSGFDLAIDDCHLKGISEKWHDYGQCDRFNETVDSPWWKEHRYSFAARQLFAYEQGLGWSFATWKLWSTDPDNLGVLDEPAKLLALQEVVAAGLMPSFFDMDIPIEYPLGNYSSPVGLACLNPPAADFVMGDQTLAPTPAPPPNCGNGWWNFSTEKCDYWIPPTPAPTPPCPVCPEPAIAVEPNVTMSPTMAPTIMTVDTGSHQKVAVQSFLSGAAIALVVAFVVNRLTGGGRRADYEQLPTN